MDEIYHDCAKGYKDVSHVLIKKDEKCLIPTADCSLKYPHDVISTSNRMVSSAINDKFDEW